MSLKLWFPSDPPNIFQPKCRLVCSSRSIAQSFRCRDFDMGEEGTASYLEVDSQINCHHPVYRQVIRLMLWTINILFVVLILFRVIRPRIDSTDGGVRVVSTGRVPDWSHSHYIHPSLEDQERAEPAASQRGIRYDDIRKDLWERPYDASSDCRLFTKISSQILVSENLNNVSVVLWLWSRFVIRVPFLVGT